MSIGRSSPTAARSIGFGSMLSGSAPAGSLAQERKLPIQPYDGGATIFVYAVKLPGRVCLHNIVQRRRPEID